MSLNWEDIDIIIDSPLASRFTRVYRSLEPYWDAEAKRRVNAGQQDLLNFIKGMRVHSGKVHLVHGDDRAKQALKGLIEITHPMCKVVVPQM